MHLLDHEVYGSENTVLRNSCLLCVLALVLQYKHIMLPVSPGCPCWHNSVGMAQAAVCCGDPDPQHRVYMNTLLEIFERPFNIFLYRDSA